VHLNRIIAGGGQFSKTLRSALSVYKPVQMDEHLPVASAAKLTGYYPNLTEGLLEC